MPYVRPELFSLKAHPEFTEKWVQERIAEDPAILGLGDLVLKDRERIQPRAGRLDLLLQDPESNRRYEVELQLGATDETHIIRTIEYWDIERKRYPQYDHCAVIIAEDITSRFLSVISLFNGSIPLIAIQMQALKVGEHMTLVFTTVLDELVRGLVDEDEEVELAPRDRTFWEQGAGTRETVAMSDTLIDMSREFDPAIQPNYTKRYIGISRNGQSFNFMIMKPKKTNLNLELKIKRSDEIDSFINDKGLDALEYNRSFGLYKIRVSRDDIVRKKESIQELLRRAYENRNSQ